MPSVPSMPEEPELGVPDGHRSGLAGGLWAGLAGQDRVVALLQAAAASPGDTYLLTGPPGVGKAEAARIFAAAILCPAQCGDCGICRRVLRGIHPDVVILEPEGYTFPVEAIREAVAQAALSPMEGARRVMIVEEADRIVERSQNALLKALEEPNPSVTWILVTSLLQPILPTILSRCTLVEFAPVSEDALAALLASRRSLGPEQAEIIVRAAQGDLERALALVDSEAAAGLRTLAIDVAITDVAHPSGVAALAAGVRVGAAAQAARAAREQSAAAELAELEEALKGGPGGRGSGRGGGRGVGGLKRRLGDRAKRAMRRAETDVYMDFCAWLAQAYRDLAALSAGAPAGAISSPDRMADLFAAAGLRPTGHWLAMAEEALNAQSAIRENTQPALVVDALLLAPLAALR